MVYSIKFKDGTQIDGIPDSVPPEKAKKQYYQDKAANAPQEGLETFKTGVGRGMTNIARNVGNLVGLVSDEELEEAARLDKPLMDTTSGLAGSVVGEIVTTAPVGVAAATGRHALARAIQASPKASALLGGAAEGYLVSDPETRGSSTALGAAGGVIGLGLSRALSKLRGGKLSDEMEEYLAFNPQMRGKIALPALLKEGGVARRVIEDFLPSMPGGRGHLKRSREMHQAARKAIHETAAPREKFATTNLTGEGRTDVVELRKAHKEVIDDMNRWEPEPGAVFSQPVALPDDTPLRSLIDDLPSSDNNVKSAWLRKLDDGTFDIEDLLDLRQEYIRAFIGPNQSLGDRVRLRDLDAVIEEDVFPFLQNEVKDRFEDLLARQGGSKTARLSTLEQAVRSAPQGEYSIQSLAQTAASRASNTAGAAGEGALQEEADRAVKALGKEMQDPGFWRSIATLGLSGVLGGLPGLAVALGGGALNIALARRVVARAVAGDLKAQRRLAKVIADNPELGIQINALMTGAGASTAEKAAGE